MPVSVTRCVHFMIVILLRFGHRNITSIHFWQVIFRALDTHVKNVVCTYSLEHNSTNGLFDSIIHSLDELMGRNENISKLFQELVYCIGILQTSVYQHMQKEEEQVDVCYYCVHEKLLATLYALSLFNFTDIMY